MSWTYITDDPATLPPLDVPVFVLLSNGRGDMLERVDTPDGWLWAEITFAPFAPEGVWISSENYIEDYDVVAWHPLPMLPKENQKW